MSAPIASERPSQWEIALIPIRSAKVKRRKNSRGIHSRRRSMGRASHREAASETMMNVIAFEARASESSSPPPPPPANASTNAIAMSSTMRMASTRSVSSSASRRKSIRPLTATADEET